MKQKRMLLGTYGYACRNGTFMIMDPKVIEAFNEHLNANGPSAMCFGQSQFNCADDLTKFETDLIDVIGRLHSVEWFVNPNKTVSVYGTVEPLKHPVWKTRNVEFSLRSIADVIREDMIKPDVPRQRGGRYAAIKRIVSWDVQDPAHYALTIDDLK